MSVGRLGRGLLALASLMALASCAADTAGDDAGGSSPTSDATSVSGTVTVLAAASLTEPFEALERELESAHPSLDVVLSFGPSSGLVEQVVSGAPADVLATADTRTMDDAVAAGVMRGGPEVFARNTLVLAVPAGNPGAVTELADLARDELRIALCEPQVPCGAAASRLLAAAAVTARPDTLTTDVKEASGLVALDEVDAALVYRTDVTAAGQDVEVVDVPEATDVVNDYPVAVLKDAPNPSGAEVVRDAIAGPTGWSLLEAAGFLEP